MVKLINRSERKQIAELKAFCGEQHGIKMSRLWKSLPE